MYDNDFKHQYTAFLKVTKNTLRMVDRCTHSLPNEKISVVPSCKSILLIVHIYVSLDL